MNHEAFVTVYMLQSINLLLFGTLSLNLYQMSQSQISNYIHFSNVFKMLLIMRQ